jgi:hypothetical protein
MTDSGAVQEKAAAPRQASIGGAGSRLGHRLAAVCCWAGAVGGVLTMAFGAPSAAWWTTVLVDALLLLVLAPLGFTIWFEAGQRKLDGARLRTTGRPAVAELLKVGFEDQHDGSAELAKLRLRISGADVPAFEANYRCDREPVYQVGVRWKATVDPADNLFTLRVL